MTVSVTFPLPPEPELVVEVFVEEVLHASNKTPAPANEPTVAIEFVKKRRRSIRALIRDDILLALLSSLKRYPTNKYKPYCCYEIIPPIEDNRTLLLTADIADVSTDNEISTISSW
jgi:hypothetical protein